MKYICLRNCFVNDRFHHQGETYELPDDMRKSEKNFRPLEQPEPAPAPDEGRGFGDYPCPECKVTHRAGSKIHKRHLKLLKG